MSEYPAPGFQYGGGWEGQSEAPAYGVGAYGEGSSNTDPPTNYQQQTYGDNQPSYGSAYAAPQSYPSQPIYGDNNNSNTYPPDQAPSLAHTDHQTEQEKGFAGALAGGVAGAYGGHQVNHGVLDAAGGAWAGSKLEDKYKESHQSPEKKEHHHHFFHRRHSSSSSSSKSKHDEPVVALPISQPAHTHADQAVTGQFGNFSHTSTDISLNSRTLTLEARCANVYGQYLTSQMNLNDVIATVSGQFKWVFNGPKGDLGYSVRDIRVEYQSAEGGWPAGWYLRGRVKDNRGEPREASLLLDKNIENQNGRLTFCRYDTRDGIFVG